jgi:ATP-dependent protease ClpP protease subunit
MEIQIYGDIGVWPNDLENVRSHLMGISDDEEIVLRINSPGGGVIEGFAIANLLDGLSNRVVAWVDGWAASMASILMMVADEVHAPGNAWIMIHRPWVGAAGDADEMRKMADILDEMERQSIDMYMRRANVSREELTKLVHAETWLTATEAHELGLVTHLEEVIPLAASWDVDKRPHNAPAAAVAAITQTGANSMKFTEWLKACPISGCADEVISELASAEITAKHVAEVEGLNAQVAAVEAERDAAKAEAEQLKAGQSETESTLNALVEQLNDKVANAEKDRDETEAKLQKMMGGMKKPESKQTKKAEKKPASKHYLSLVQAKADELGDYEKAIEVCKEEHAEEFAAMLAENPTRKED